MKRIMNVIRKNISGAWPMSTLVSGTLPSRSSVNNTIWKYYAFAFLKDLAFFSAVLVPFFTEWGGISLAQVQILQSWFMFWLFVLEIPTGAVADYIGRKHSVSLGALIVAFAVLVYGSVPKFEIFLLGEFLFAIAMALISGADEALLYDSLKEAGREDERKQIFGKANSFHLLGMLIAAPVGSFIASRQGLNAPMLYSAIPYLLAAIVAWSIREPKIRQAKSESRRYVDIVRNGLSYLRNHKVLRLLALDAVVVASSAYFIIWLYQPFLKSIGVGIFYFGLIHALLVLSEILVSSNFERLTKFFKSDKTYLRASALIVIASFLLVAVWPNIVTILILILVGGGFGLTRLPLMSSYMNKFIPSEQRATVLSSISMLRRFALVVLNPFIGFAADHSLRVAALIVGLLPLAIFFFSPIEQEMLEN
jgi:MFS family permease